MQVDIGHGVWSIDRIKAARTAVANASELCVAPVTMPISVLWRCATRGMSLLMSEQGQRIPHDTTTAEVILPPEISTLASISPWRVRSPQAV